MERHRPASDRAIAAHRRHRQNHLRLSPDSGTTVWHYDADGNVSSKTDAASAVTNMTYDALDRILTRTYPADSSLNVAYTYDQTGHGKGIGRLTSVTDQAGSLSLSYDERGSVTSNARTIGATTYTTTYTWDSVGTACHRHLPDRRLESQLYTRQCRAAGHRHGDAAGP
jgi:YD repeat-containing protein